MMSTGESIGEYCLLESPRRCLQIAGLLCLILRLGVRVSVRQRTRNATACSGRRARGLSRATRRRCVVAPAQCRSAGSAPVMLCVAMVQSYETSAAARSTFFPFADMPGVVA